MNPTDPRTNLDQEVDYNEVLLKKFKLVALSYLDKRLLEFAEPAELSLSTQAEWLADQVAARFTQSVWGIEVQRKECTWPADWWQAFKERWFPEWAKQRWPVRYHSEVITARELYPQVSLPPDQYKAVITVSKTGDGLW